MILRTFDDILTSIAIPKPDSSIGGTTTAREYIVLPGAPGERFYGGLMLIERINRLSLIVILPGDRRPNKQHVVIATASQILSVGRPF